MAARPQHQKLEGFGSLAIIRLYRKGTKASQAAQAGTTPDLVGGFELGGVRFQVSGWQATATHYVLKVSPEVDHHDVSRGDLHLTNATGRDEAEATLNLVIRGESFGGAAWAGQDGTLALRITSDCVLPVTFLEPRSNNEVLH